MSDENTQQKPPEEPPKNPPKAPEAKKPAERKKAAPPREPDPYEDYADAEAFPAVLTLATGELVGAPNIQSTHHWSRKLECDVPVVGRLTR